MSEDVQSIVALLFFLILLGIFFVPLILFLGYVFYQTSKRKRIRQRVLQTNGPLIGSSLSIPVRYATDSRFKTWFKVFPWEGAGLLLPAPGSIQYFGEQLNGVPVSLHFQGDLAIISWLGKCPFPNGAVSWFVIDSEGRKHYFTSETGVFVFGSNNSTRAAFDTTRNYLLSGDQ